MNQQNPSLMAVDWGSSNFRAYLLNANGMILKELKAPKGVLQIGSKDFELTLEDMLSLWLKRYPHIPVMMTGMIGSAHGWINTDYLSCPVTLKDIANHLVPVKTQHCQNPLFIVPGLKGKSTAGNQDVMRGEETQILGSSVLIKNPQQQTLFCLPGTHSKWVNVKDGAISQFDTFITGELFGLLTKHSILGKDLPTQQHDEGAFRLGVQKGASDNSAVHELFSARAEVLSGELSPAAVHDYISGIIIGHEVYSMMQKYPNIKLHLIGSAKLSKLYSQAMEFIGFDCTLVCANNAVVGGLYQLAISAGLIKDKHQVYHESQLLP